MTTCKRVFQVSLALSLTVLSTGAAAAQDQRQIEQQKIEERKQQEVRRLREQIQVRVGAANAADQKRLEDQKIEEQKVKERLRDVDVKVRQATGQSTFRLVGNPPGTHGFSVVLVLGDLQGASSTSNDIPEAARKALDDMKAFLPFKSYRLLDAAWILGQGQSTGRLRGIDDHLYSLELSAARPIAYLAARPSSEGSLQMRVRLEEAEVGTASQEDLALKRAEELETRGLVSPGEAARLLAKRRSQSGGSPERPVVATSFSMDPGETVVVGTSRLNGDKALILLLTAVPVTTASGAQPGRK